MGATLVWEDAGTGEPGDQNADSRHGAHAYWSLGPASAAGWWSVELIVRDCDLDEVMGAGVALGWYGSENEAKYVAQRVEDAPADFEVYRCHHPV